MKGFISCEKPLFLDVMFVSSCRSYKFISRAFSLICSMYTTKAKAFKSVKLSLYDYVIPKTFEFSGLFYKLGLFYKVLEKFPRILHVCTNILCTNNTENINCNFLISLFSYIHIFKIVFSNLLVSVLHIFSFFLFPFV